MRRRRIQDAEGCYTERRRCRRHGAEDLIVSILLESSMKNERIKSDDFKGKVETAKCNKLIGFL